MNHRPDNQSSYLNLKMQLDAIVEQVRDKDLPLERALDLYEEAVKLGNSCADHIDRTDFSMDEIEAFNASKEAEAKAEAQAAAAEGEAAPDAQPAEGQPPQVEEAPAPAEAEPEAAQDAPAAE